MHRKPTLGVLAVLALALAAAGQSRTLYALAGTPTSGQLSAGWGSPEWWGAWLYAVESGTLKTVRQIIPPAASASMPAAGPQRRAWLNGGMFGVWQVADDLFVISPEWADVGGSAQFQIIHASDPDTPDGTSILTPKGYGWYGTGVLANDSGGTPSLLLVALARGATPTIPAAFSFLSVLDGSRGATRASRSRFPNFAPAYYGGNAEPPWSARAQLCQIEAAGVGLLNPGPPRAIGQRFLLVPLPPMLPVSAVRGVVGKSTGSSGIIIASNQRFFVFSLVPPSGPGNRWADSDFNPTLAYVYDRKNKTWRTLRLPTPADSPACRIFGDWLTTPVSLPRKPGNTAHPGMQNERGWQNLRYPPVARMFLHVYAKYTYMPGKIQLNNLADGRVVTITTNQENSEALDVSPDGEVIYRVNDEIREAHIEGSGIGPSTLLAKGEDVPEVHWVFWSNAKPPQAAPKGTN